MKYKVEGDQVIFEDYLSSAYRKRGRRPGTRLAEIIRASDLTLSDIARIYSANRTNHTIKQSNQFNCVAIRANLSHVLANRDNSPAYIQAIEKAWRLPIATIREYYQLDKTNPLTRQEQFAFKKEYLEKYFPEQVKAQQEGMLIYKGLAA